MCMRGAIAYCLLYRCRTPEYNHWLGAERGQPAWPPGCEKGGSGGRLHLRLRLRRAYSPQRSRAPVLPSLFCLFSLPARALRPTSAPLPPAAALHREGAAADSGHTQRGACVRGAAANSAAGLHGGRGAGVGVAAGLQEGFGRSAPLGLASAAPPAVTPVRHIPNPFPLPLPKTISRRRTWS